MRSAAMDRILTGKYTALPMFVLIMAAVFWLTFNVIGAWLSGLLEMAIGALTDAAAMAMEAGRVNSVLQSLVIDGIFNGVGSVLSFLPTIVTLFFFLSMLEDSGYMARVAYVMDGLMGYLGLSGKALLPMVLGFGCTVPAIMATRALEKESDRRRTILITPFMSCSARLPIYVLFAGMFFGKYAAFAAISMYFLGMAVAIVVALVIHRLETHTEHHTLLIELPEYKTPNARTIAVYVWEKIKDYLTKAGTTIFIASIIIWFLLNFGIHGMVDEVSRSFGAVLGHWMEPILAPAGLGMWQIGVALISGISAKEVVVSSFCVLFGINNVNSTAGMLSLTGQLAEVGFGPLNAYCMMVFCLLYVPCAATIGTIKKETGSMKFTLKMLIFQLVTAWLVSVLVYQIGSFLTM